MNKDQARELIRRFANQRCVAFSRHCSKRMRQRSVTSDDFLHVLMWGTVESVEFNSDSGQWNCEVQGDDIDGDDLTLHIAIDKDEGQVVCITVV